MIVSENGKIIEIKAMDTQTERFHGDSKVTLILSDNSVRRIITGDVERRSEELGVWARTVLHLDNTRFKKHVSGFDLELQEDLRTTVLTINVPFDDITLVIPQFKQAEKLRDILIEWINE